MSLFAISDLHLALDPSLDKPMDVFDDAWRNYVERLEVNWKRLIKNDDVVVVPGDISWGIDLKEAKADLMFLDRLPGKKVLLRGNHDYWWASMAKMRGLYPSIEFIQNDCFETEDYIICGTRGWVLPWGSLKGFDAEENERIYKRELIRLQMTLTCAKDRAKGREIICCVHFPPLDKDHKETEVTRLFKEYGVKKVVYGHLHIPKTVNAVCDTIDGIEYNLVSLDYLDAMPLRLI